MPDAPCHAAGTNPRLFVTAAVMTWLSAAVPDSGNVHGLAALLAEADRRTKFGITDFVTWGAMPGIEPAATTPMIERFAREVVPQVKARVAEAVAGDPP
jgi:hypothetical protein